jgi:dihydroxy-acid dehydratase
MDLSPGMFNKASKSTPFICGISPNGAGLMQDLDEAGGIPAVMKELEEILDTDVMTVTGQPLSETLKVSPSGDGKVIKTMAEPIAEEGGLIFLEGTLAPDGALVKRSAVPKTMYKHEGPARIFVTEDDASNALMAGEIEEGAVVVVRGMGPAGDTVSIDIGNARLDLLIDDVEMARRRQAWVAPEPRIKTGYLSIYSRNVDRTSRGASLKYG